MERVSKIDKAYAEATRGFKWFGIRMARLTSGGVSARATVTGQGILLGFRVLEFRA